MSIYFGFSDECGSYQRKISKKSLRVHPYYIRSTLIIDACDWKKLKLNYLELKEKYELPVSKEIKWSYLWQLREFQKKSLEITSDKDIYFLKDYDYHKLIAFVSDSLNLLSELEYCKIIITHTKNIKANIISEKSMLKMHLQEHMQRIQMEVQHDDENLAVLFFDPISEKTDKQLRDIYFELINNGDFIKEYSHIKDSLNIENSHQSVGIQLADFISGTFSSMLKGIESSNYELGKKMFFDHVYNKLRKKDGKILGYGIREVPLNKDYRNFIKEKFTEESTKYCR